MGIKSEKFVSFLTNKAILMGECEIDLKLKGKQRDDKGSRIKVSTIYKYLYKIIIKIS